MTDPFLLMMEDWFPRGVFDHHPHRGMETVTYVLEGALDHHDNHGNQGRVAAGDVAWLTAGRGLVHNEQPLDGTTVHLLQLWVNLPAAAKLAPARFQDLKADQMPMRQESGVKLRVFSGTSDTVSASTLNHAPVLMVDILLQPGAELRHDIPADYNGFVLPLDGEIIVGASRSKVHAGELAWLSHDTEPSKVSIEGGSAGAHVLLIAGQPLREPVASRGPFVMNSAAELATAFAEYQVAGSRFGL